MGTFWYFSDYQLRSKGRLSTDISREVTGPHATRTCVDEVKGYLECMRISTSAWRRRPTS
jgi:hypothetical protein